MVLFITSYVTSLYFCQLLPYLHILYTILRTFYLLQKAFLKGYKVTADIKLVVTPDAINELFNGL